MVHDVWDVEELWPGAGQCTLVTVDPTQVFVQRTVQVVMFTGCQLILTHVVHLFLFWIEQKYMYSNRTVSNNAIRTPSHVHY